MTGVEDVGKRVDDGKDFSTRLVAVASSMDEGDIVLRFDNYCSIRRRCVLSLAYVACLVLIVFAGQVSSYSSNRQEKANVAPTLAEVVVNVRKALRYDRMKGLPRGFVIEEERAATGVTNRTVLMFSPRGEVRQSAAPLNPNPILFDGTDLWIINRAESSSRFGSPVPLGQRSREKTVIPFLIRSGWWLDENATLEMAVLPGESDEKHVVLSIKLRRGVVGSKLLVSRETWLPSSLIVEYEKGPYTIAFKDYRETLGFFFPYQTAINYDKADREYHIKSVAEVPAPTADAFLRLPQADDTSFDNNLPAQLKIARGERNSDGTQGHAFVRPLVDGRDAGWFHFDTGAESMSIDTRLADELKMPVLGEATAVSSDGNVRKVTVRRGKTFQLGRVTITNPTYIADDLSKMSAPPGERRAGFCGYPLFVRAVFEVSRGGESIALYDPATYRLAKGRWQRLSLGGFTPSVRARLEGNLEGLFMLDTGASTGVDFNSGFAKERKLLERRKVSEIAASGSGGTFKQLRGSLEWFELAGHRFKNPKVTFRIAGVGSEVADVDGVIGREFMSPFTIVFNYPEMRIAFLK